MVKRKATAEAIAEELCARAESNNYKRGVHPEKDSTRDIIKHNDEASARHHCLRNGVNAPDMATVKDCLRFYISISHGYIDEKPTVDLVNMIQHPC
jgi:hypothetical protein